MTLAEVQAYFYHLCFDETWDTTHLERLPPGLAAHLHSQSPRRRTVYRELIFNNVSSVIHHAAPIFFAHLGADAGVALLRRFLADYTPRTRFYRHLPQDFAAFLSRHAASLDLPHPFLRELADLECSEYELIFQENDDSSAYALETVLESARIRFNSVLMMRYYGYPVDCMTETTLPASRVPETIVLLAWRHPQTHRVWRRRLSETEARFFSILADSPQITVAEALAALARCYPDVAAEALLQESLSLLGQWIEEKIVVSLY